MGLRPSDDPANRSGPPLRQVRKRSRGIVRTSQSDRKGQRGGTRTIKILRKNNREEVHVRVTDLGGTSLIDLRVFEPNSRKGHEPAPTRSGICLPRFQLRALIEALQIAEGGER